ncbi:MAG: YraN family protein [Dysgonomonas sp.]|nr:YraN family protein [Dysgonomonas sp.]
MAEHNDLGKRGEEVAAGYLRQKGYTILKCNWVYAKYEVDIIATNEEYIIFAEVKTRASARWGNPEEAVSKNRIKRMVEAADFYLNEYDIDMPVRFDVLSLVWTGGDFEITHFDDAFLAPVN